ncbi:MAG: hypothetical protein E2602_00935 [Achromobacter sp.]|nr:hypothetical protein [Achromobacter sp.]
MAVGAAVLAQATMPLAESGYYVVTGGAVQQQQWRPDRPAGAGGGGPGRQYAVGSQLP